MDRTKTIFSQNYYWTDLRDNIGTHINVYNARKINKEKL